MSTSIKNDIVHLQDVELEIKRKLKELKELRDVKSDISERIQNYLVSNDLPGIKHKGITVLAESRQRRKALKKSEKHQNAEQVLSEFGIENSKEALDRILDSMRGEPEQKTNLRIL